MRGGEIRTVHSEQNQHLAPRRASLLLGKNVATALVQGPDPGQQEPTYGSCRGNYGPAAVPFPGKIGSGQ